MLTVGGPVHEWREGEINGVVSVGPLECMPNKLSESQFFHVAEQEGLPSVTLSLNGDPVDPEVLDNFAYEVHEQFRRVQRGEELRRPRPDAAVAAPLQRLRRAVDSFNMLGRRPSVSAPAPVVEDRTGRVEVEEQPRSREFTPASLLASLARNVRPRPRG